MVGFRGRKISSVLTTGPGRKGSIQGRQDKPRPHPISPHLQNTLERVSHPCYIDQVWCGCCLHHSNETENPLHHFEKGKNPMSFSILFLLAFSTVMIHAHTHSSWELFSRSQHCISLKICLCPPASPHSSPQAWVGPLRAELGCSTSDVSHALPKPSALLSFLLLSGAAPSPTQSPS